MIVLGLDTATSATTVALRLADGSTSEARDDPAAGEHPGHATRLLEMARGLLDGAGVDWKQIDRIAVGVGPGTFTGLRVGVATARGLAQSLSVELVGVSSLLALAEPALAPAPAAGPPPEGVLAVLDARRGEAFAAAYGQPAQPAGGAVELASPQPYPPERLASVVDQVRASAIEPAEGSPRGRWLAVGDGAIRYRDHLISAVEVPDEDSRLHLLAASAICALGARAAAETAGGRILPDYRRRPDAELALEAATAGTGSEP